MSQYAQNTKTNLDTAITIYNGRAAFAGDALEVDAYTTWLAASNPWDIPVIIGAPLDQSNAPAATPIVFEIYVSHYTRHIAIQMLCTGQGSVDFDPSPVGADTDPDTWDVKIPVGDGDGGTGVLTDYMLINSDAPVLTPGANDLNRAINIDTPISVGKRIVISVAVNNATGKTLRVWALRFIPLLPNEAAVLPA